MRVDRVEMKRRAKLRGIDHAEPAKLAQPMFANRIAIETINLVGRAFVEGFAPAGPVIDIGSYYTERYAALCDRRPMFPGRAYVGCDIRTGPGVDRIEDAEELSFADGTAGVVLLLEILEHLPYPDRALREARRVLADDGVALISSPFDYRLHGFPSDFWRFTASGLYTLLEGFPSRSVFAIGPWQKPSTVFGVASKGRNDFAAGEARMRAALQEAFHRHRRRHALKVLEERGRDLAGVLFARARNEVAFFDPGEAAFFDCAEGGARGGQ